MSGVFPAAGFAGRHYRVELSGDASEWTDVTSVSFGDGITVGKVSVSSPSSLFAEITIEPGATLGLRDIAVVEDGETLTLKQAFEVRAAVELRFSSPAAQGGVVPFQLINRDFDAPFDTTSTGDGFFTPLSFPNLQLSAPAGVQFNISSAQPFALSGTAFFDVDAQSGPATLASGTDAAGVTLSQFAVDVAQRSATVLLNDKDAKGTVSTPFGSALYELSWTASPALIRFNAVLGDGTTGATVAILPVSGRYAELVTNSQSPTLIQTAPGKVYAVILDLSGTASFDYTLHPTTEQMSTSPEAAGNDTAMTAQPAGNLPYLMTGASLSGPGDEDWIKVTVSAADVGKRIHVLTAGDDRLTDTVVEIFFGGQSFSGPSDDNGYAEDFLSPPLTSPGEYDVRITPSPFFDPAHKQYQVGVWLE